jgi:hypothetical protein
MIHQCGVVGYVPVDTVGIRILNGLVCRLSPMLQPTWTVLKHTEEEDIPRRPIALTANVEVMGVPSFCPLLGVSINMMEEEVVKKPNMCWYLRIEAVVNLKYCEELLPLLTEAVGDIIPEPLNARVVDAPVIKINMIR